MKKLVSTILVILLLLTCAIFTFVGCTSTDPLVGKWQNTNNSGDTKTFLEVYEDGTAYYSDRQNTKSLYAWTFDKTTKQYFIWANWAGAYSSEPEKFAIAITNDSLTFSFDKSQYSSTGRPNGYLGGENTNYTKIVE